MVFSYDRHKDLCVMKIYNSNHGWEGGSGIITNWKWILQALEGFSTFPL
jgi:hypothetical protein